ncbi:histidine phosphatase family protein [Lichenicola sp.]|uniref:histidine phosphatase family protein n=1 Tax=Lichenicola sp. TaxID=2804529 RepID=UPI003AFFFF03
MILLRHCQSEFNLHFTRTRCDPGIIDPALTAEGLAQADAAAVALAGPDARADGRITRLIVSPYRRALQTAAPIAARLGLEVTIEPMVRERFAFVCDVGSPRSSLERDWPGIDFSCLDEIWWNDGAATPDAPPERESEASVIARADRFRARMASDPAWPDTLLVSHWGFLLALSGRSIENGQWLRIDPTEPLREPIVWRHATTPVLQKLPPRT